MALRYFRVIPAPSDMTKFMVNGADPFYHYIGFTDGSYQVYFARVFGLTFPSYLRMIRDNYGATIRGKGHKYPSVSFDNEEDAMKLAKELDRRFTYLVRRYK